MTFWNNKISNKLILYQIMANNLLDAIMSNRKNRQNNIKQAINYVNYQWTGGHDYYAPFPSRPIEVIDSTFSDKDEIISIPELSTMKAWRKNSDDVWVEISVENKNEFICKEHKWG